MFWQNYTSFRGRTETDRPATFLLELPKCPSFTFSFLFLFPLFITVNKSCPWKEKERKKSEKAFIFAFFIWESPKPRFFYAVWKIFHLSKKKKRWLCGVNYNFRYIWKLQTILLKYKIINFIEMKFEIKNLKIVTSPVKSWLDTDKFFNFKILEK